MSVDPEFLRQVDNAIRYDLQSWRDLYFVLLIWSSILVGVGVALEGPEVIHDVRNIRKNSKPEAAAWIKLIGLLGWIFVVVGIAGEGIFEGALSAADEQIQAFDEILVGDAQRSGLIAEAGNLNLGIDLAAAQKDLRSTEIELARQQERAAKAQKELITFERNAAWRIFSAKQLSKLKIALAESPGQSVILAYSVNDPDALYVAEQLAGPFSSAGWKVWMQPRTYLSHISFGVRIMWLGSEHQMAWPKTEEQKSLVNAFRDAGIDAYPSEPMEYIPPNALSTFPAYPQTSGPIPSDAALIFIGSRQPPVVKEIETHKNNSK